MERLDQSGGTKRRYFEVAQTVLLSIAADQLAPGDRLPADRELAAQHGVSRATAREAILALELVGAVEIQHGNGVYVRATHGNSRHAHSLLAAEALPQELMEARQEIEPGAIAMAASRVSSTTVETLRAEISEARSILQDTSQLGRFIDISFHFHARLAHECGNRLMAGIVSDLINTEVHPLWTLINQQVNRTQESRRAKLQEHIEILDAIESGQAETARTKMREHLESMARSLFL